MKFQIKGLTINNLIFKKKYQNNFCPLRIFYILLWEYYWNSWRKWKVYISKNHMWLIQKKIKGKILKDDENLNIKSRLNESLLIMQEVNCQLFTDSVSMK